MKLADELRNKAQIKFESWLDEFAEKIKPKLIEDSSDGYENIKMELTESDEQRFFIRDDFEKRLSEKLGGCQVSVEREVTKLIIGQQTKKYLFINWEEQDKEPGLIRRVFCPW